MWAEYHQAHNGEALRFFAGLAIVIGLPILTLLVGATLVFLIDDRIGAKRQHALRRRVVLLGLKTELQGARDTAGRTSGTAWTALPYTTIEQALAEAGPLGLPEDQIVELHELRLRILTANGLVGTKLAGHRPGLGNRMASWAAPEDGVGRAIRSQCEAIAGLCDDLLIRMRVG